MHQELTAKIRDGNQLLKIQIMQKWLLTIIIAILPVITACSKSDTDISAPEEKNRKENRVQILPTQLMGGMYQSGTCPGIPN